MYKNLDKIAKKEAKANFFATENGKELKKRFKRINISIILLIIYSTYLLIFNNNSGYEYYLSFFSLICALAIFVFSITIKTKLINDFLNNNKSSK